MRASTACPSARGARACAPARRNSARGEAAALLPCHDRRGGSRGTPLDALDGGEPVAEPPRVVYHDDAERRFAIAHRQVVTRAVGPVKPGACHHLLGDDQLALILLGQRLEAAGDVDPVADGREIPRLTIAHRRTDKRSSLGSLTVRPG